MPLNASFLQELLNGIAEQGRALLPGSLFGAAEQGGLEDFARALISGRGEASGVAIARRLQELYERASDEVRRDFFRFLAADLAPDASRVKAAATAYCAAPSNETLERLQNTVDSPRRELFRRLNLAPAATYGIVTMRRDLLRFAKLDASLLAVDHDLRALLQSWFNRGFLVLRQIDWQSSAAILEKIITYEAVHEIKGWTDLRRRLDPKDRRCFGFFHPALIDEPLIFVEVALSNEMPAAIAPIIEEPARDHPIDEPSTAVFYSISNCQDGLKGISFGSFLIKQVAEVLAREQPSLKSFVTLSPVPRFARWLDARLADERDASITAQDRATLAKIGNSLWLRSHGEREALRETMLAFAARYFLVAKADDGRPLDSVARFHLGNGARLERINWMADASEKGLGEGYGLMVNYRYDLREIERNHEAFANDGAIVASRAVRQLLRSAPRPDAADPAQRESKATDAVGETPVQRP